MIEKMGAAVVAGLVKAVTVVLLVMLLIALIGWARSHPAQAQALVTKFMDTAALLLTRFFNWVATWGNS